MLKLLPLLALISCATPSMNRDAEMAEKYPECWHEKRVVFDKCIQMNKAGAKITALRVDQLMRDGKLE